MDIGEDSKSKQAEKIAWRFVPEIWDFFYGRPKRLKKVVVLENFWRITNYS